MDSHLIILGNRIRHLRKDNDLTQKELSGIIGLTPKMISFYENNQRTPPIDILVKLAKIFNVTVDYLIGSPTSTSISELSIKELNLLKYFRSVASGSQQEQKLGPVTKYFPNAAILSSEEQELVEYYSELSVKDRRWIMGQMIDVIKKAHENHTEIPKAQ